MVDLVRVPHCKATFSFAGWDNLSPSDMALLEEYCQVMVLGLGDDEEFRAFSCPDASLPVIWAEYGSDGIGGKPVEDPLTLRIAVPTPQEDPMHFDTTLRELIVDSLQCENEDGILLVHPDSVALRNRIVMALRGLAAEIEQYPARHTRAIQEAMLLQSSGNEK